MNVGSLFSGVGGLDLGLARAGHQHVFFCEWDAYRRDVLRARWPGVPVYDDVRSLRSVADADAGRDDHGELAGARGSERVGLPEWDEIAGSGIDLLAGGFPCQDLSVAGRRAGLDGARSGLFFEFARIADALRPRWLLVENVPGLLSSNGGRDFGIVLGTLADLGYGVAWRILDSRFFGVPQRRRRVFIVGTLAGGDPRAAAERAGEVLAVGEGCRRHLAPRGEARPQSPLASLGGLGSGGPDDNDGQQGRLVAGTVGTRVRHAHGDGETMIASTLRARTGNDTLRSHPRPGSATPGHVVAAPLTKGSAYGEGVSAPGRRQEDDVNLVTSITLASDPISADNLAQPSTKRNGDPGVIVGESVGVRRLTPVECERLQSLPDGWTDLGGTPDSKRYSAVGDAVTSNVAEFIGRRLV